MNVVRFFGRKRTITLMIGCALGVIGIQFALTPHQVTVIGDHRWAPDIQAALRKKVERVSLRTVGIQHLKEDLTKEYPCLKDITITYSSSLEATVTLVGWRPIVQIRSSLPGNKEYVVCEEGVVIDKGYLSTAMLQSVPTIVIVGGDFEAKRTAPELIDVVLNLNRSLFDQYTITWHSKTNISLRDKKKPLTLTADITSIHDKERYAYIQKIFETEGKYKKGMKADIRLKDSLVCAPLTKQKP